MDPEGVHKEDSAVYLGVVVQDGIGSSGFSGLGV